VVDDVLKHQDPARWPGVLYSAAHVGVVDDVLEDHHVPRPVKHLGHGRQRAAVHGGERAAVHVITGEPFSHLVGHDVGRPAAFVGQARQGGSLPLGREQRTDAVTGRHSAVDHLLPLSHEKTMAGFETLAQFHIGEPDIVRQARIGGVLDKSETLHNFSVVISVWPVDLGVPVCGFRSS